VRLVQDPDGQDLLGVGQFADARLEFAPQLCRRCCFRLAIAGTIRYMGGSPEGSRTAGQGG
jgi:hypothetical protein